MRGSVKKVLPDKGFGFIRSDGGEDVFFHRSAVKGRAFGRLREGTPVEFNVENTRKGPRAMSVRLGAHDGGRRVVEQSATPESECGGSRGTTSDRSKGGSADGRWVGTA